MTLRILVADDEEPARRKLRRQLAGESDLEVVAETDSGPTTVEAIEKQEPDLVLLDVQMPGMTGLEVIEAVGPERMPAVVFVTAYDEHAIAAFELEAVDYLLKPVAKARLLQALARARKRIAAQESGSEPLRRLLGGVDSRLRRLVVRERERVLLVDVDEVTHFKSAGNYVEVHTAGATHLIRETMDHLEERLDPERFARIHRSAIVNIGRIQELRPHFHGDYEVRLDTGTLLRLSRRYRERILDEG